MLKIFGAMFSSNVNKVRYTANYIGLDYEFVPVDILKGEQKSREFLQVNPAGKVPVIVDDGFILFESMAIARYLASKNNSPLYPDDLREKALVDQWIDFCSIHLQTATNRIFFNRIIAPKIGIPKDEDTLNAGIKLLEQYLPVLENQLEKNEFLTGSFLSIADINLLAILDPAEPMGININRYKNMYSWFQGLKREEFYTRCHMDYSETLATLG